MATARDVLSATRRDLYRILADGDNAGGSDAGADINPGADPGTVNKDK